VATGAFNRIDGDALGGSNMSEHLGKFSLFKLSLKFEKKDLESFYV
jgi:hypothetical protein